jgi:mono/diheme cytochrome c family protein
MALGLVACDHPNPLAPAEPIGEFPQWGLDFTVENKAGADSMFNPNSKPGPAPDGAPNQAELSGGGASAVPNQPDANKVDVSGGDVAYGQQVFLANCAKCHGPEAKGGEIPMIGTVANLTDKAWQAKVTDAQIASTIAHGKGQKMPGFMGQLQKRELDSVVAFLRSLAR